MNSLTTTSVFSLIDKIFNIKSILSSPLVVEKYVVDKTMYANYIQNLKGFKFPLVKQIINALENDEIKPVLFAEPRDKKNNKALDFPSSIPGLLIPNKGKIMGLADVSFKGKYMRNSNTDEIEFFRIDDRAFYTFMQMAYINRTLHLNKDSLGINVKFVKTVCEAYSYMLCRCISAIYPISANKADAEILKYITIVFCLQNFFGYNTEKARSFAFTFRGIDRAIINNDCSYFSIVENDNNKHLIDMSSNTYQLSEDKNKKYPSQIYVNILSNEFSYIKSGKMQFRNIVERFTSMYGQNSVLSIEHCGSFVNMLLSANMKIGLYNDLMIDKNVGTYIDDLYKVFNTVAVE